jgi:hypothetical protein
MSRSTCACAPPQRRGVPAPGGLSGLSTLRFRVERRRAGELAARGNAELAVDVAGMGANGLDADVQDESDLRVRLTLLEQRQHFGLTLAQQYTRRDPAAI